MGMYKVGDRVEIKKDLSEVYDTYGASVVKGMLGYAGRIVVVTRTYGDGTFRINIEDNYYWSPDMVEEYTPKVRGFEPVVGCPEAVLPVRGTKTSAGYDFIATKDLVIEPGQVVKFPTNVKAFMLDGEVLLLDIRSSLGVKKGIVIANIVPVIDSDYYSNPDNDGNINIALRNINPAVAVYGNYTIRDIEGNIVVIPRLLDLTVENTVKIKAGERVAQGIFMQFLESDNCNTETERTGGIGSTGKE